MHSVLIVDDEPFVRTSVVSMRTWADDGFDLSHEASNGKEALEILAAHPEIDIVLLDISMPVMDGIEFLRRRGSPGPAVIVLSAYDDFHLVRTAFLLGAMDYLRKEELEGGSLRALLDKTAAAIGAPRDAASSVIERSQVEFLRSQMLRDLLAEPVAADTEAALASLGVRLGALFFVCAFWVRDFEDVSARFRAEGLQRFTSMLDRSLGQMLAKRGSGHVVGVRPDHSVVFFLGDREAAAAFGADAKEYLERYLSIRVSFCVSGSCERLDEVRSAYRELLAHRGVDSRIIVLAKRFIRESFADHALSLSEIAARAGVSKNHLSWEFTRETGETITEHITRVRIDEAKRLFSSTRFKVYEVGERVGYQNVEHFSRVFKKLTGTSPREWSEGAFES